MRRVRAAWLTARAVLIHPEGSRRGPHQSRTAGVHRLVEIRSSRRGSTRSPAGGREVVFVEVCAAFGTGSPATSALCRQCDEENDVREGVRRLHAVSGGGESSHDTSDVFGAEKVPGADRQWNSNSTCIRGSGASVEEADKLESGGAGGRERAPMGTPHGIGRIRHATRLP
jgi:hypothetical protein